MKHHLLFTVLCALCMQTLQAKPKARNIKRIPPINIQVQQGHAPTLPYQIWVTYTNGTAEWRQVRWENSQRNTEQQQAATPLGKAYIVQGYIIGSNATEQGYPIEAKVSVVKETSIPQNVVAEPLPLKNIALIGQNRLTNNAGMDVRALLALDVSQQLYNYRDTYGLPTDGYTVSDGWDSPTTKLKGHGSGHYMSALAFAYNATQERALKDSLLTRIRRMVDELRQCQERTFVWSDSLGRYFEARDLAPEAELQQMGGTWADFDRYKQDWKHYGYGYLNAIPAQHPVLIEMYRAYNNESWVWAPYYSIHKQLAGLIDIAQNVDDKALADKAALIAHDMGLWVWNRLHHRTYTQAGGTREARRTRPGNRYEMWDMYIAGEVGGMAESLARLSEMADNPKDKARLMEAASYFDAPAFFNPLSRNIDDIRTRHANQHIPMITGALRIYRNNADPQYYRLARNFWHMVQGRYMYAMGGVGNGEMFRQPYAQMLSMNTNVMSDHERNIHPNPDINETCCAYNLAKLTKELNCFTPDDASLMDYYERVMYNQIVGSLHPHHWACTYQYAVGLDARKPFGNETPQSSCCGGTGVENHVKYPEAAYFANDSTLWVALYLPTVAQWQGLTLRQECTWPAERSTIHVQGNATFAMKLRVPYWATQGFRIRLNGKEVTENPKPCSYVEIPRREWQSGDVVEIEMPFAAHIHYGPDKMDIAATGKNQTNTRFAPQWLGAVMYGPLVMASPDINNWQEAEISLSTNLKEIQLHGAKGDDGTHSPLYTLSINGRNFQPDYYQTERATHYLRLTTPDESIGKQSRKLSTQALNQAIALATERTRQPQSWAPHGMKRLRQQLAVAQEVASQKKKQTQEQINAATSALNMAINAMRPSNLAEPEDLAQLLPLLSSSKQMPDKSTRLREAINYADMVVQYVNDGSGTHDLIEKATRQLQQALEQ